MNTIPDDVTLIGPIILPFLFNTFGERKKTVFKSGVNAKICISEYKIQNKKKTKKQKGFY